MKDLLSDALTGTGVDLEEIKELKTKINLIALRLERIEALLNSLQPLAKLVNKLPFM